MVLIISQLRQELKKNIDPVYKKGFVKYFGGEIKAYGVRTPYVRKIARQYFAKIKSKSKQEVFSLCEKLLQSDVSEEATVAFQWALNLKKQYQPADFEVFESWLDNYVNNWAKCDDFCTHAFAKLLIQFPEYLPHIKKQWVKSSNRWLRRGSAVILISAVKHHKKFLPDVFETANRLLKDKDDLVQKGYGWLLKEASNKYQQQVFDFVMERKNWMPRTALRYAIEKMPKPFREQAMAK